VFHLRCTQSTRLCRGHQQRKSRRRTRKSCNRVVNVIGQRLLPDVLLIDFPASRRVLPVKVNRGESKVNRSTRLWADIRQTCQLSQMSKFTPCQCARRLGVSEWWIENNYHIRNWAESSVLAIVKNKKVSKTYFSLYVAKGYTWRLRDTIHCGSVSVSK